MRLWLDRLLLSLGAYLMTGGRPASVVVALAPPATGPSPGELLGALMHQATQHQRLRQLSMLDGLLWNALRERRTSAVPEGRQ